MVFCHARLLENGGTLEDFLGRQSGQRLNEALARHLCRALLQASQQRYLLSFYNLKMCVLCSYWAAIACLCAVQQKLAHVAALRCNVVF